MALEISLKQTIKSFLLQRESFQPATKYPRSRHLWHRAISKLSTMEHQPSNTMENNFDNMSPVVNHDIFADDMTDMAPTPILLPSQLVVTEDSTIVPAAGSLGSPAAGSLHRHGSVAVYGIPGIPNIALYGISGIHGSRYNPLRLSLPDVGIAGTLYHPSHAA